MYQIHINSGIGNVKEKYYIPEFIWEKLNLLDNTTLQRYVLDLRENEEIPFDTVCDVFGWNSQFINDTLKREMFSLHNPKIRDKVAEAAAGDNQTLLKILKGEPVEDLTKAAIDTLEKEVTKEQEKAKKKEKKEEKVEDKEEEKPAEVPEVKETEKEVSVSGPEPEKEEKLPIGEKGPKEKPESPETPEL